METIALVISGIIAIDVACMVIFAVLYEWLWWDFAEYVCKACAAIAIVLAVILLAAAGVWLITCAF